MEKYNLKSALLTDLELLNCIADYLFKLRALLPSHRLVDHCSGALASVYELHIFLKLQNLKDYGNNQK